MKKIFLGILIISLMSFSFVLAEDLTCGVSTYFNEGDSLTYLESNISITSINHTSVTIESDGVSYTLAESSITLVGDTYITIVDVFYRTDPTESLVSLFVGCSYGELTCDTNTDFQIGDSYTYLGKTISLESFSSSSIVVNVNGTTSILNEGDSDYIDNLLIYNRDIYDRTEMDESTAVIFVGCVDEIICGQNSTVHVDGSLIYNGTWVTLNDVSSSSANVEVEGVSRIIPMSTTASVGSLRVRVNDISSTADRSTSKATLTVPCSFTTSTGGKFGKLTLKAGEVEQGFFAKIWAWISKAY